MVDRQQFIEIPEFRQSDFSGGILSRKVFERLQVLVDQMNEQANQLDEWREKVIQRLRLPLLDQTTDPDGEYFPIDVSLTFCLENFKEVLTLKKRLHLTRKFYVRPLQAEFKSRAGL
jgi:hypothetical protein